MGRKSTELSVDIRERIIKSYEENTNISELSRIFGIPRTTIGSVIKKFNQTGSVENRSGRGRKKLFTVRDSTELSRVVKQNRRRSLADITTKFNENKEHTFCKKTVERKIHDLGYKRRVAKKSVTVRDVNKNKRVAWARERKNWTVEREWKKWIFSDESQIVIGANNKILIWRKDHEINEPHLVCPRPRGRVSLMVWGCICYEGVGTLTGVEGNINAAKYIEILEDNLWPVIAQHFPHNNYVFQDDNAPVHRAGALKTYCQNNNINTTEWPAQSPDINIIENIWLRLKRNIEPIAGNINTREQLLGAVRLAWENISITYIRDLYETIPRRLREVIRMKGNLTKF